MATVQDVSSTTQTTDRKLAGLQSAIQKQTITQILNLVIWISQWSIIMKLAVYFPDPTKRMTRE